MFKFRAGQCELEAQLLVFDKDGLMFDSQAFWRELASVRCQALINACGDKDAVMKWAKLMGTDTALVNDRPCTKYTDPLGILAVASPLEETVITAGFLTERLNLKWSEALKRAKQVFAEADALLDLSKAITPQPGYTRLMNSIIQKGLPYCVATSDTYARTRDSMSLFDCFDSVLLVVTPDEVPKGKPAPDMLIYISEKTNTPPSKIAMIGDSVVDVEMAHNAGAIGIGVSTDTEMRAKMKPFASAIISTLCELEI